MIWSLTEPSNDFGGEYCGRKMHGLDTICANCAAKPRLRCVQTSPVASASRHFHQTTLGWKGRLLGVWPPIGSGGQSLAGKRLAFGGLLSISFFDADVALIIVISFSGGLRCACYRSCLMRSWRVRAVGMFIAARAAVISTSACRA